MKAILILALIACASADFLPSAISCGDVKALECALDIKGAVTSCSTAAAESGLNPIADIRCIKNVLGVEHKCVSCICDIAQSNNWTWLESVCKQQGFLEMFNAPVANVAFHGCGLELEEKCAIDLYATFEQCAKAEAQGGANIIADFKCVKDVIAAAEECDACICKAAEENGWAWIQKEVCGASFENLQVMEEVPADDEPQQVAIHGCGLELEEICAIDLYATFEQCAKAEAQGGANIIADFKCVKDIIAAAEECDACICKAAEENGWAWIQKEVCGASFENLQVMEEVPADDDWVMIEEPEEVAFHGCGLELEEICAIDLYATFEQCAKAEAQGGANIIADFKCVKDIIAAAEECDACICKAAEENGWAWIQKEVCAK